MNNTFREQLKWHTNRSVPIVLVDKAIDEIAVVKEILQTYEKDVDGYQCLYVWDASRGLRVDQCRQFAEASEYLKPAEDDTTRPDAALDACQLVLDESLKDNKEFKCGFVFFMGDRIVSERHNDSWQVVVQKLLNMRDLLKQMKSCIYLVGIDFAIPAELEEHVAVIPADRPDADEIKGLITATYDAYSRQYDKRAPEGIEKFELGDAELERMVDTLTGMSAFNAEQTLYLSTDLNGIHTEKLRDRAIQTINSTRGLSVARGDGRGFAALGGLQSIKDYATSLLNGNFRPKLIVILEEVEKALSGAGSDTSGVSGNLFGSLLTEMQETNALGMMFTGIYGCAKSEFAKRLGEEAGTLTVRLDLSGLKDSLVGSSESNMRKALAAIKSIGGSDGGTVFVATCNRISQLPPEFKRRFNLGTFFFSFPDTAERGVIWHIYKTKYGLLDDNVNVNDENWTGAEIESCCRIAHLMKCTLAEAAMRIVPVYKLAADEIEKLMLDADSKFLSASYPGTFQKIKATTKEEYIGKEKSIFKPLPSRQKGCKLRGSEDETPLEAAALHRDVSAIHISNRRNNQ